MARVSLSPEERAELEQVAKDERVSLAEILRRALRGYVDRWREGRR